MSFELVNISNVFDYQNHLVNYEFLKNLLHIGFSKFFMKLDVNVSCIFLRNINANKDLWNVIKVILTYFSIVL